MYKYLIIGGTGSLGTEVIGQLLKKDSGADITALSRGELKQKELKAIYPTVKTVIADIKDASSLNFTGFDTVFHFAALKHVDVAEDHPVECIKTNILGTINVAEKAIAAGVKYVVFCSTDKAVLPINVYGMSKGISEKYLLNLNSENSKTRFSVFRWGNVSGSRGSVINSFIKDLKDGGSVNITDSSMTRFWIHIKDAAKFLLDNYETAPLNIALIPSMKSSTVVSLAKAAARHLGIEQYRTNYCGIRRGEKYHECIWSDHDHCVRSDNCERYSDEELLNLVRNSI